MKILIFFRFLLPLIVSFNSCTAPTPTPTTSQTVATIDLAQVLDRSPELQSFKEEEKKIVEELLAFEDKRKAMLTQMREELEKIADPDSMAYRNKQSGFQRQIQQMALEDRKKRLSFAQKRSSAYDRIYRQVIDVALRLARKRGALVVLPQTQLPDPYFGEDVTGDPLQQLQFYMESLRSRPVVASSSSCDITRDVLKELNWKK